MNPFIYIFHFSLSTGVREGARLAADGWIYGQEGDCSSRARVQPVQEGDDRRNADTLLSAELLQRLYQVRLRYHVVLCPDS